MVKTRKSWHMRSPTWIAAYLGTIVIFAAAYLAMPSGQFSQDLSTLDALYFSVITITTTTTGFGDITAKGAIAKACVSIEATAGITIVGLFLASMWGEFTSQVETRQDERLARSHKALGMATMFLHWRYIGNTVSEYRRHAADLETPGDKGPAARNLLETEKTLENDLKYMLANESMHEFLGVRNLVFKSLEAIRESFGPEEIPRHTREVTKSLEALADGMDRMLSEKVLALRNPPPREHRT